MSYSILKAVFMGDIQPCETNCKSTLAPQEMKDESDREMQFFEERMTTEEKKRFEEYHCLLAAKFSLYSTQEQYSSFILGMLMGMELMEEKEVIISSIKGA